MSFLSSFIQLFVLTELRYFSAQGAKPGEPLYAQVNREKKKNRQYEGGAAPGPGDVWGYEDQPKGVAPTLDGSGPPPGGDSWV